MTTTTKKKAGPRTLDNRITLRLEDDLRVLVEAEAEKQGVGLGRYIRQVLDREVTKSLKNRGR